MQKFTCGALVSLFSVAIACGANELGEGREDAPPGQPASPADNAQAPPDPVDGKPVPGVYVSRSKGSDDGTGSTARPLQTLKAAFALAKQQGLRVIACAETYEGSVELVDGVSAYGYYDCNVEPWKRGGARAKITSTGATPAVIAKGLTLPTRIEGFEIVATDLDGEPATATSGTSVAVDVRDSRGLVFGESLIRAGKAAPGIDGEAPAVNAQLTPAAVAGTAAKPQGEATCVLSINNCATKLWPGPAGGTSQCAVGPGGGAGGAGGAGTWYNGNQPNYYTNPPGTRGLPLAATTTTAVGGEGGLEGTNGARGTAGADGQNGVWTLGPAGFVPGNGTGGSNGGAGQGGGGGGGSMFHRCIVPNGGQCPTPPQNEHTTSDTGGSGGAGGCPGLTGTPGTGGGASIGAFVVSSDISFERTRIETSLGGRAGRGFLGTPGTPGGAGGPAAYWGAKGGNGGDGGPGGVSGHGAPGPSIALAHSGAPPKLVDAELVPGSGGEGYPEETQTSGAVVKVLPAVVGESKAMHAF
ncbi:MAG: hypothetical protein KF819_24860 [Labilithrix sp.]|nr:hypothetical protein [Labilithrix sp.]